MRITTIDEKNRQFFENMIPEEYYARLNTPSVFAIGTLAGKEEKTASGVLLFSVEEGSSGGEDLIAASILWLYVAPEFRRQKAADQMMETFFTIMDQSKIEYILCDIPMPEEYDLFCAYLEAWGFRFGIINRYELDVELGRLLENRVFSRKIQTTIVPLKKVSQAAFGSFRKQVMKIPGVLQELPYMLDNYEDEVSCVSLKGNSIRGALLVQKVGEGRLDLLLFRALEQPVLLLADLMRYAVQAAGGKYPSETRIHIVCRQAESAELVGELFPDIEPLLVRRGVYDNREE